MRGAFSGRSISHSTARRCQKQKPARLGGAFSIHTRGFWAASLSMLMERR